MIRMHVVDDNQEHFIIVSDEPITVEVCMESGHPPYISAKIYKGNVFHPWKLIDSGLTPCAEYDGSLEANKSQLTMTVERE